MSSKTPRSARCQLRFTVTYTAVNVLYRKGERGARETISA